MHKQLHVTHEVILITTDNFTTAYLPGQNSKPTLRQTTWHSQCETNRYTKWNNVVIKSTSVCADIPENTGTYHVFTFLWTYSFLTYNYRQIDFRGIIKIKQIIQTPKARPDARLFISPLHTFTEQPVRRLHSGFVFRRHPVQIELGPPTNLTDVFRRFRPSR